MGVKVVGQGVFMIVGGLGLGADRSASCAAQVGAGIAAGTLMSISPDHTMLWSLNA